MKVWGFDPSSKCGFAIFDNQKHISAVHCEVFENTVKRDYYWYSVQLGRKLRSRIVEFGKPDLVVIEQASESTQGTGVDGVIWAWDCVGAVVSLLGVSGVPIATITPGAWRKPFYGRDFVPPQIPMMKDGKQVIKNGKPQFKNDWKTAAVEKCTGLGIILPRKKTISHNAAEAVGIAHSWAHAQVINEEFDPSFMALRQRRNEREAA